MKLHIWKDIRKESRSPERLAELKSDAVSELLSFRLRELREELNVTQVELAKAAGMTQPQISKLESNNDALLSTLQRYAEAIGGRLEINVVIDGEKFELLARSS